MPNKIDKEYLIKYYQNQTDDSERMYKCNEQVSQTIRLDKLKELTSPMSFQNKIVLSIGCGDGFSDMYILPNTSYKKYYGLDLSHFKIQECMKRVPKACGIIADAESVPFKDDAVDIIFCFETLEHLIDYDKTVQEIKRVLRPGGKLVVSVPIDNKLFIVLYRLINKLKIKNLVKKILMIPNSQAEDELFNEHINTFYYREFNRYLKNNFKGIYSGMCSFRLPSWLGKIIGINRSNLLREKLSVIPAGNFTLGSFEIGNMYGLTVLEYRE